MRQFIMKISILSVISLITHILLGTIANGSTDNFYAKFTSKEKNSLILGESRAAQGIIPNIIDSILKLPKENHIYNFSFTIINSPYGKLYYNSIKKKLKMENNEGVFILNINPISICIDTTINNSDQVDQNSILSNISSYSKSPNYEYLLKNYSHGWGRILLKRIESILLFKNKNKINNIQGSWTYLHENGWLEVSTPTEASYIERNIEIKIKKYEELLQNHILSPFRLNYLDTTIRLLKKYGDVYLVRMPVHDKMLELEEKYVPDLDSVIAHLSKKVNVNYINLIDSRKDYIYTDGNHLYKTSAKKVSENIAQEILKYKNGLKKDN